MATRSPPPGLMQPTMKSYTAGTNNPRDSAMAAQNNANAKQTDLINAVKGGSRKGSRRHRKGSKGSKLNILDWNKAISGGAPPDTVVIPQAQLNYIPPGTNPNQVIKAGSSTSMQSVANSKYDAEAANMKGGNNPNWNWGCLSGGKRFSRRKMRKCRRKTRRCKTRRSSHHRR